MKTRKISHTVISLQPQTIALTLFMVTEKKEHVLLLLTSLSLSSLSFFYILDEQLRVYLYASIPHQITGTGDDISEAVQIFFNQLDIHIESSVIDNTPPPPSSTNHQRTLSKQITNLSSAPSSPQLNKRDQNRPGPESLPFFSHTYNSKDPEPTVFEHNQAHCCLFPVDIPIGKKFYIICLNI
jgi:hypothetical protein